MSQHLRSGNVVLGAGAGSYYGGSLDIIPGYDFHFLKGYISLSPQANNRFPIWVPSEEKGKPRKRMQIPHGANVYHVGARAGKGVWNEASQDLVVTAVVAGAPVTAQAINIDGTTGSGGLVPPNAKPHEIFRVNGTGEVVTRTTLLRTAGGTPVFNAARLDDFNIPLAYQENDGIVAPNIVPPIELEVQTRVTTSGGIAGALTGIGANVGGLRANSEFPKEAYILLQVGFFLRSSRVVGTDDFAGVVWDEVFANV